MVAAEGSSFGLRGSFFACVLLRRDDLKAFNIMVFSASGSGFNLAWGWTLSYSRAEF